MPKVTLNFPFISLLKSENILLTETGYCSPLYGIIKLTYFCCIDLSVFISSHCEVLIKAELWLWSHARNSISNQHANIGAQNPRTWLDCVHRVKHGLRTPREDIAFTARPKILSQSQIFRYGRSIICLTHPIGPIFQISLIYAFIGSPLSVIPIIN